MAQYIIADPCYVIGDWGAFGVATNDFDRCNGRFTLKDAVGTVVVCHNTAYGDGVYEDGEGNEYPVDAGLLGCILADQITGNSASLGHLHEFDSLPTIHYNNGTFTFSDGNPEHDVVIDTGDAYDDDDDDDWGDDDRDYND